MIRRILFLLCLCLGISQAMAQSRTVTGTVTDQDSNPMVGVTVLIKGTFNGTSTDLDGNYSLSISGDASEVITFSFIGMESVEVPIGTKDKIDATLSSESNELEEVVVIGYGAVRKKEMTGAASQVTAEAIESTVTSDLGTAIQGMVPGVSVTASSGEPGAASNIQIRGVTSISGSNTPLWVVDGIPQEDDPQLSSNEIASIDILKDAASCAIYGTRGAAGVILVTTNQGDSDGVLKVSIDGTYGLQQINENNLPELMDTEQSMYFSQVTYRNGNSDGIYAAADRNTSRIRSASKNYVTNTNPYDFLISNNAPKQSYNLNITGGSGKMTFSAMGGFYNEKGVLPNSNYERFNFRGNMAYKADKYMFSVGTSMQFSDKNAASGSSITTACNLQPYYANIDTSSSSFTMDLEEGNSSANAIKAMLKLTNGYNNTKAENASLNVGFNYEITDHLQFTSKLGTSFSQTNVGRLTPNITIDNYDGEIVSDGFINSSVSASTVRKVNFNTTGGFNYNNEWGGGHKLTAMALASYEEYNSSGFSATQKGVLTNDIYVLNAGSYGATVSSATGYKNMLFGGIGRVLYDYQSRYMLSLSMRADASSMFSSKNRWGYFPSASVAWNVADELFFSNFKSAVNNFKVRASYGTTGNQSASPYIYNSYLVGGYDYAFGGTGSEELDYGLVQQSFSNPDLKWETSKQINLGVDLAFLKNKFTLTADVYKTFKEDMLAQVTMPTSAGGGSSNSKLYQNIGNMENQGIEIAGSYKLVRKGGMSLNVSANFAKNINEVTELGNNGATIFASTTAPTVYAEGYEAGAFFCYQTNGVIKTPQQLAEYKNINSNAKIGDLMYVDKDNSGNIDQDDRVYMGSAVPDFEGGLNINFRWKGFDVVSSWYGTYGNEIINGTVATTYATQRNVNCLYTWTYQNPNSDIPNCTSSNFDTDTDVWIEDGSYLRMKTLTVGYTFKKIIPSAKNSSLRLYATGQNLLTFTEYSGLDPEVGGNGISTRGFDNGSYPISRQYLFGAKLSF